MVSDEYIKPSRDLKVKKGKQSFEGDKWMNRQRAKDEQYVRQKSGKISFDYEDEDEDEDELDF